PGVVRLAAGGWIERGAIEVDPPTVIGTVYDPCLEVGQIGVRVVEALGHRECLSWAIRRGKSSAPRCPDGSAHRRSGCRVSSPRAWPWGLRVKRSWRFAVRGRRGRLGAEHERQPNED